VKLGPARWTQSNLVVACLRASLLRRRPHNVLYTVGGAKLRVCLNVLVVYGCCSKRILFKKSSSGSRTVSGEQTPPFVAVPILSCSRRGSV